MLIDSPEMAEYGWWAFLTLSANQTSNFASGDQVEFDTIQYSGFSSAMLDTVTNVGRFTLPAGKTFELEAFVHTLWASATAYAEFAFYDVSGPTKKGIESSISPQTFPTLDISIQPCTKAIITPVSGMAIELRRIDGNSAAQYYKARTYCKITQIRDED